MMIIADIAVFLQKQKDYVNNIKDDIIDFIYLTTNFIWLSVLSIVQS